jgi:hypothetical protein
LELSHSAIASVGLSRAIIEFIATHRERSHIHRRAFSLRKFALLILLTSGDNLQRFVL